MFCVQSPYAHNVGDHTLYGNKIKPTMWVAMIYAVLYANKIYIMLYMPTMWVTIQCMEIKLSPQCGSP